MRRFLAVMTLVALAGCGGSKKTDGTTPTPTPAPTASPGPGVPTFTRLLLNGSLGESGVVTGDGATAAGAGRPASVANPDPRRAPWARQAMAWTLSAVDSPTNLHPAGRTGSELFAQSNALFVGWTTDSGGTSRATLWDRAASNASKEIGGSFTESRVYGVSGKLLAGQGRPSGGTMHAVVWDRDAADAPTDLNGSFTSSTAFGISGARVVGIGASGGADHAVLWTSPTATSATDLHPAGVTSSEARGVSGSIVAGSVITSSGSHAGFWNLAAGNAFTDLTQGTGVAGGAAYATNGRFVVGESNPYPARGFVSLSGDRGDLRIATTAMLWDLSNGNAVLDLHKLYLDDLGFEWSAALGVDAAGNVYGVGGGVIDDFNANYRAWVLVKK